MFLKVLPWDHYFFLFFLLTNYLKYAWIVLYIFIADDTVIYTTNSDLFQIQNYLHKIIPMAPEVIH